MRRRRKEVERAAAPPPAVPRFRLPALAIFALALVVRLLVAWRIGGLPISRTPHFDSLEYLQWARALADGQAAWPVPPAHGPGYPFFLALFLWIGGGSLAVPLIAQAVLGACTCVLIAMATKEWFGRGSGIAAGTLLALYGPLAWIDASLVAEGLLLFFCAAALAAAARGLHPALIGASIGLAVITRPTAIILLPVILLLSGRTLRRAAFAIVAMLLVIAPVTIANWRTAHAFIPVQAFGGMNFYLGNAPSRDGLASARPGADWERIEPLAARQGILDPAAEDRFFVRKTISEIAGHPGAFALLLVRKLVWTLQNDEVRDTHSFAFFRLQAPLLRFLPSFLVLIALAAAGMFAARWDARPVRALALYVALAIATCVFLVVGARYRLLLVPGLAPFAGLGFAALVHARVSGDRRRFATLAAVAVAAAAGSLAWRHVPSANLSEEWALTGQSLVKEGRDAEAEEALQRAVASHLCSALAHDGLGMLRAARGDRAGARASFDAALQCNDEYAKAHAHAGPLAMESGDVARAAVSYTRAAELDPRNRDALVSAAQLAGATGNPDRGLDFARRALALREDGQTWALLAVLAADAQQPAAADEALRRALALIGNSPELQFTTALVRHKQHRYADADRILRALLAQDPDMADARALDAVNRKFVE